MFKALSDSFTGLTDSVAEYFGSSGDSLRKGLGAGMQGIVKSQTDYQNTLRNSRTELDRGMISIGTNYDPRGNEGQLKSIDPNAIESMWLNRLNKFAEISSATAVKPR